MMLHAGRPIGGFVAPHHSAGPVASAPPIPSVPSHIPSPAAMGHAQPGMGIRAQDSLGLIKQRILANALRGGAPSGHPVAPPMFQANKVSGLVR
jgi:hypothetical protein